MLVPESFGDDVTKVGRVVVKLPNKPQVPKALPTRHTMEITQHT
jgi:hypothetical protein